MRAVKEVRTFDDIRTLVAKGVTDWRQWGHVSATYRGELVLLSYTAAAYGGNWNWLECTARGLILNWRTGETVAWPFEKFWKWGWRGYARRGHIVNVTEKIDGSLGILYREPGRFNTRFRVATRSSFGSAQALWATDYLATKDLGAIRQEWTPLVEIVYPENRIIVDYGDYAGLMLLAIRNRFTGEYLPFWPDTYTIAQECGLDLPPVYHFNSVEDILEATDYLPVNQEGYVAEFSDGSRWKFKGDRYRDAHKVGINPRFGLVVRHVAEGTYDAWVEPVPYELRDQLDQWRNEIAEKVADITAQVEAAFAEAPQEGDRRGFADFVRDRYPDLSPYLFMRLDGKPYEGLIYRKAFG